jgi:hypothetical protein
LCAQVSFSLRETVSIPLSAIESQRLLIGPRHSLLALIWLFAMPNLVLAQASEWFGTWRLILDKSVYQPGPVPYKRATMKVERVDGKVRFSYDFVHLRGGVQHLEWTGSFDGKDYIVQGADEYITYAYKQVSYRTYEIVAKTDGRVAAVATVTLSSDGRTLTTVTRRKNSLAQDVTTTTVHEKVH